MKSFLILLAISAVSVFANPAETAALDSCFKRADHFGCNLKNNIQREADKKGLSGKIELITHDVSCENGYDPIDSKIVLRVSDVEYIVRGKWQRNSSHEWIGESLEWIRK